MVHVAPRHLATADSGIETVLDRLPAALGWTAANQLAAHSTSVLSPCERLRLEFRIGEEDLWQLVACQDPHHGAADWGMRLSWRTPPELVAVALEEANAAVLDDHGSLAFNRGGGSLLRALFPLAHQGWTDHTSGSGLTTVTSPDGYANATVHPDAPEAHNGLWNTASLAVACPIDRRTSWHAHFTAHTPLRVLIAFTTALASPEPFLRNSDDLTEQTKELLAITPFVPDPSRRCAAVSPDPIRTTPRRPGAPLGERDQQNAHRPGPDSSPRR